MKRIFAILLGLFIALQLIAQPAKYVFYFIGDGMGVNMINFTEYYLASEAGQKGILPLEFAKFPVCNFATTWSANSCVTDSAASGTALATGTKTNNHVLGLDPDGKRLTSIAEISKKAGKKIGIVTTVGANHATPAAFFGHQDNRNNYDQLVFDMTADKFDFYAGSDMLRSKKEKRIEDLDYRKEFKDAGYTIVGNVDECMKAAKKAKRILFLPDSDHKVRYAIDRTADKGTTTLADFVECTVDFFMKGNCKDGFFIMAEGGKIDGACHGNDAATAVKEIIDLEEAVKVALKFYAKHPAETAIIITADHDTGGSAIAPNSYSKPSILDNQVASAGTITSKLKKILKDGPMTWDEVKNFLSENLGLYGKVKVKDEDDKLLRDIYDETVAKAAAGSVSDEYGYNDLAVIVSKAVAILDKYAGVTWTTKGHSASFAPVFYKGPKPEIFSTTMDNSYIAPKLLEISVK